jgi:polysaccharide pyruvyl transferase WcaK-like protein/GT2 family glycosyltransferase
MTPTVAAIVVARNEARLIARCIGSLARQTRMPDKIILVDDGSTDDTVALARAVFPALIVLSHHTRSLAQNRNAGWRSAGTDYVAFLDADCEAPSHWLGNLLAAAEQSGADAVGGGNHPPLDEGKHYAALAIMLNGFLGSRGSVQGTLPLERRAVEHLPTLNVLYRTATLEGVGGFDPRFVRVGEDEDLSRRIGAIGGHLLVIPDATVIHRQRPDIRSWARNMYVYGKGRTWLLRRHPNALSPVFLLPPLMWLLLPVYLPLMAVAAIGAAIAAGRPFLAPRIFLLFLATHLPYGAGQVIGLIRTPAQDMPHRRRVAVLALKNSGNKGDEAIMHCVCQRLMQDENPIDYYLAAWGPSGFDIRPLPTRRDALDTMILDQLGPSDSARKINLAGFARHALRSLIVFTRFDNIFIGGGQWLHDLSFLRHAAICAAFGIGRLFGTRVGVFCVGVGPLSSSLSRFLVRLAFGRDAMMVVRDEQSGALLERCGIHSVTVATDPVIEMTSPPIDRNENRILISPCAWTSFAHLYREDDPEISRNVRDCATLIEKLRSRGRVVQLLPTMNPEDIAFARRISEACGDVEVIDADGMTPEQVQREIAGAGLLIAFRLHPVIFGSNVGTPVIAMDYAAKVRAFCCQMGIEQQLVTLDNPQWVGSALTAIEATAPEAFRASLAANRPALIPKLNSAYSRLSFWLSE